MKTMIVYYSFTGNNEALVQKLKERLGCDAVRIQTKLTKYNTGPVNFAISAGLVEEFVTAFQCAFQTGYDECHLIREIPLLC